MARESRNKDSASCQFFIVLSDDAASSLDGSYAGFGKVIEGMDVVDKIAAVEVELNAYGERSAPVEPIVIESAVLLASADQTS